MGKILKNKSLLIYFFISILFSEIILKISAFKQISINDSVFMLIFSFSLAIVFFIIATWIDGKDRFISSSILLFLISIVFSSQLIYFKFFRTFYTIYSAAKGSQILQFWQDILIVLKNTWVWLLLFFLPPILMLFLRNRLLSSSRPNWKTTLLLSSILVFINIATITGIYLGDRKPNSSYDLYSRSSNPLLMTQRFGLLTSMRLEAQKLALKDNFSILTVLANRPGEDSSSHEVEDSNVTEIEVITKDPDNSEDSQTPSHEPDEPTKEVPREPNILDIDFKKLASAETDQKLKDMHEYFDGVEPTHENEYTGKYRDYNLILITAESFAPYAIHREVTPTLYKMVNEGYQFTDFYNPIWGVSTSDGEYVACTSLLPKPQVWSFYKSGSIYMPFAMGNQLGKSGYSTRAYHNHTFDYYRRDISHPNMGYEYKGIGNGLNLSNAWPRSDLEMMEKTVPEYIGDTPFHTYYMTVSGHMQYNFMGNAMAIKNKAHVQDLPYTEAGKAYIATHVELDRAMEHLLDQLEEAGIADKTLIAISADHYPYGLENDEIADLVGHKVEENFELYKSTFILYTKGMEPVIIDKPCSSLDIIPTLSNLLGIEYDSRLLMGRDIFSDSDPLVVFLNRSFITDKGRYNALNGEFYPKDNLEISDNYIDEISKIVEDKFHYSAQVLDMDYYRQVLEK